MRIASQRDTSNVETTVLRTTGPYSPQQKMYLVLAVLVVALVIFVQIFIVVHDKLGVPWEWEWSDLLELFRVATQKEGIASKLLAVALLSPIVGWLGMRAMDQRMEIGESGIRFATRLPGFAKRVHPDWYIPWEKFKKVRYGRHHPMARGVPLTLVFKSTDGEHKID